MNVTLPSGRIIQGVPEGTPKEVIMQKAIAAGLATPEDFQRAQQQPTQQQPMQQPSQSADDMAIPGNPPQQAQQQQPGIVDQTVQGVTEAGRSLLQAGVNVANIVPEVGDAVQSAAAWLGGQFGVGDGTYTPASRFELPEVLRPQTQAGQIASQAIPYLVNPLASAERGAVAIGSGIDRLGARAAGLLSENTVGALAENSNRDNAEGLGTDLAAGSAASGAVRGLLAAGGAAGRGISRGREAFSDWRNGGTPPAGSGGSAAEDAALATVPEGATPQQAAEIVNPGLAMRNQPPVNAEGVADPGALRDLARQSGEAARGGESGRASFASQINPDSRVLESARRIGVDDALTPGSYSQNPAYRAYENALGSTPNRETYHAQRAAIARLGEAADNFIADFGGSLDKSFANEQVRSSYGSLIDGIKKQEGDLYNKVREAIPTRAQVEPRNTLNQIYEFADDLGGVDNLPTAMKNLLKKLDNPEATPTYGLLDYTRKEIGNAGANKGAFKDEQKARLDRLYDALTEDQGVAAAQHGARDMWDAAKAMSRQRFAVQDAAIKGLGKDLNGDVVSKLQKHIVGMAQGSGTPFRELVNNLPPDVRQAAVVTAMNKAFTTFAKSPGQQLGVPGFTKWYQGMMRNKSNLQSLNRVLGYDGTRRLNDIYQVARGMNRLGSEKVYSHSQIDKILSDFDKGGGLVSKVYQVGKKAAAAEGVTSSLSLPGVGATSAIVSAITSPRTGAIEAADKMLASKSFQELTRRVGAPEKARAAAERALTRTPVYQRWYDTLAPADKRNIARVGLLTWLTEETQQ